MSKQTKKERLDEVKDYINEVLSNPFSIEVKVTEDNGNIIVDCGCWVLSMGIEDDWFNVSTGDGCGIGEYDLDQIVEIRDNKETILEIYNGEWDDDSKEEC